jgi:hypothetical protein
MMGKNPKYVEFYILIYIFLCLGMQDFSFRKNKHPIDFFDACVYTERESRGS